jgi:hypothetical protein
MPNLWRYRQRQNLPYDPDIVGSNLLSRRMLGWGTIWASPPQGLTHFGPRSENGRGTIPSRFLVTLGPTLKFAAVHKEGR